MVIGHLETPTETIHIEGKHVAGGDYEPGTLLAAYRAGLFISTGRDGSIGWLSPGPRFIMTMDRIHISNSLRRARNRFITKINAAFVEVVEACADRKEGEYQWLVPEVRQAVGRLHQLGWAHSVEAWTLESEEEPSKLVGGLYGIAIGGLFCGESMFSRQRDASKVAFAALVGVLKGDGRDAEGRLIDVQMRTPHLASLGAYDVSREEYMERLKRALKLPLPAVFNPQG